VNEIARGNLVAGARGGAARCLRFDAGDAARAAAHPGTSARTRSQAAGGHAAAAA